MKNQTFNADTTPVTTPAPVAVVAPVKTPMKSDTGLMAKLKEHKWVILGVVAVAAVGGYLYLKHKHHKKA